LTGDLPTPVKYDNPTLKNAYKELESIAENKLISMLPEDLREDYRPLFGEQEDEKISLLLHAADKISAVIKCIREEKAGNSEFIPAKKTLFETIAAMNSTEADIFVKEFLPAYELSLDELSQTEK